MQPLQPNRCCFGTAGNVPCGASHGPEAGWALWGAVPESPSMPRVDLHQGRRICSVTALSGNPTSLPLTHIATVVCSVAVLSGSRAWLAGRYPPSRIALGHGEGALLGSRYFPAAGSAQPGRLLHSRMAVVAPTTRPPTGTSPHSLNHCKTTTCPRSSGDRATVS